MLAKFKEEREKQKMAPPAAAPTSGTPTNGPPLRFSSERDFRPPREEFRERERGYHSSRYE
jgi:hypothetical protein